jgi:hypothetical protein
MDTHSLAIEVGMPTIVSGIVFVGVGLATKVVPEKVKDMITSLKKSNE